MKLRRYAAGLLGLALVIGSVGCGSDGPKTLTLSASTQEFAPEPGLAVTGGAEVYADIPITDTFRQNYADFSLKLLRESRREENNATGNPENMMVSPLSAMLALEMTRSGAREETEVEMAKTLYGELSAQEGKEQLLSFLQNLPREEQAQFHFANSIWFRMGDTDFVPEEDFLMDAAGAYEAGIYGAPFDEDTVRDINNWVKYETDGMIDSILNEIPAEAVMYLINALAFEARWSEEYEKNDVRKADFFPEDGEMQTVDMMYSREGTYLADEMAVGFIKHYESEYAFLALLPKEGTDVDAYVEQLTPEKLVGLIDNAEYALVDAGLPKFKAETDLDLNEVLKSMGMLLAFDENQADFKGMGQSSRNIYISSVRQKTFVEVDETGTRAAAVTSVEPGDGAAPEPDPTEIKTVILDRPFVYGIVDTRNGLPLFLGIMDNPG